MFAAIRPCLTRLWDDDRGSVIASEYLALGSIVALGSITGLAALRDATIDEMREYGQSVRAIRQHHSVQSYKAAGGVKDGSAANEPCPLGTCP
jgi:hypothetical protein